jgi:hypothetical protein
MAAALAFLLRIARSVGNVSGGAAAAPLPIGNRSRPKR